MVKFKFNEIHYFIKGNILKQSKAGYHPPLIRNS